MIQKKNKKKKQISLYSWREKVRHLFGRIVIEDIDKALLEGYWHVAIKLCQKYLKKNPGAIPVVLAQSQAHERLGEKQRAKQLKELAYSLDDTYIPAIHHHAMQLMEDKQIAQALELFALIKDHPQVRDGVDTALSELSMRRAQANLGREYQLRSWMANFDNLRHANGYLFRLVYALDDELLVAQEHQFWAQTVAPYTLPQDVAYETSLERALEFDNPVVPAKGKRLRIGYWGSDFKEHSVRYFARPLLEGHDKSKVEIIIYDDNFMSAKPDKHTEAYKAVADYFLATDKMDDDAIACLIASHDLDVLVDIQGHTSANRMHLLQHRFAKLQITGLAYPPTTGLSTVDYKLVDRHMLSATSNQYYTERQMVLPESFWCFDPKEDAPYSTVSPWHKKGHLTLACFGNAAKISQKMLEAWAAIFSSGILFDLRIVSPSFGDPITEGSFRDRLDALGIPLERVITQGAVGRDDLWYVYQEVDLMLDTYPFNGGTTTCWATYAGVPVLTMAGNSLASCMGKSVMMNLGFPDFVTDDYEQYSAKAIDILKNPEVIDDFRQVARNNFKQSSLGNQKKFAAEFEKMCQELIDKAQSENNTSLVPDVPPLDLDEMLRRARMVWFNGNITASERILENCKLHYGLHASIVEYEGSILLSQHKFAELEKLLQASGLEINFGVLQLQIQFAIAQNDVKRANEYASQIVKYPANNQQEYLQQKLWEQWILQQEAQTKNNNREIESEKHPKNLEIWVIGDSKDLCEERIAAMRDLWKAMPFTITFRTCGLAERIELLNEMLQEETFKHADITILLRESIEIFDEDFIWEISAALENASVVGMAGGLRWTQKDWTQDLPEYKAWGMMRPSKLEDSLLELHYAGINAERIVNDAVVLDGKMLAFQPSKLKNYLFDEEMQGTDYWAEEDWCNRIALAGERLCIHRALPVIHYPMVSETNSLHTSQGQVRLLKRLKLDTMQIPNADYSIQAVHVASKHAGYSIMKSYTGSN